MTENQEFDAIFVGKFMGTTAFASLGLAMPLVMDTESNLYNKRKETYMREHKETLWNEETYGYVPYMEANDREPMLGEVTDARELPLHQGWHPFYIFPALYVFSAFLVMALIGKIAEPDHEIAGYYLLIPVILGILNIIACVKLCKPKNRIVLLNSAVLVKCALIPLLVEIVIIILGMIFLSIVLLPFVIKLAESVIKVCLAMVLEFVIFGTPYSIAYLVLSVKAGLRSKLVAVIHGLLQFCVVLDIVDVLYLAVKEKKWIKFCVGLVLVVVILIITTICSANI